MVERPFGALDLLGGTAGEELGAIACDEVGNYILQVIPQTWDDLQQQAIIQYVTADLKPLS